MPVFWYVVAGAVAGDVAALVLGRQASCLTLSCAAQALFEVSGNRPFNRQFPEPFSTTWKSLQVCLQSPQLQLFGII